MKQYSIADNPENVNPHFNLMESTKVFKMSVVVSAYYFSEKPRFEPRPERYDFSQIMLILDGEGTYSYDEASHKFGAGMMFYRPAGKSSIYEWSTDNASLALISFICDTEEMSAFEGAPISLNETEMSILLDVIKTCARICEPLKYNKSLSGMKIKEGTPPVVVGLWHHPLNVSFPYCTAAAKGLICFLTNHKR